MEESDITLLTFSGVAVQAMAEGAEVDRLAAAAVVHRAHGVGEVIAGRGAHSLVGAVGEELHAVRTKATTPSSLIYTALDKEDMSPHLAWMVQNKAILFMVEALFLCLFFPRNEVMSPVALVAGKFVRPLTRYG